MFNWNETKEKIKDIENWLSKELSVIRTGRATPTILDFVQVDAYGSRMPVKEVANILVEDVKTVRVEPWDQNLIKNIEKAINDSNLGLSLSPFEKGLRVIFPDLTSERREQFIKVVKGKLEESRISVRSLRDKVLKAVDEKEKSGALSKDDKFRLKEELQKIVDDANVRLEDQAQKKEMEIKN